MKSVCLVQQVVQVRSDGPYSIFLNTFFFFQFYNIRLGSRCVPSLHFESMAPNVKVVEEIHAYF